MSYKISISLFIIFWLIKIPGSYAQTLFKVSGRLQDSVGNGVAIKYIELFCGTDTVITSSGVDGRFTFNTIKFARFSISIKDMLYNNVSESYSIPNGKNYIKLRPIILKPVIHTLEEVTIKGKIPLTKLKLDTVEYNTQAFKVGKDAMLEDLLKLVPNLQVDNKGTVTTQGKTIYKLKVNGKDFFSGNLAEFINQLPADILAKIQIINDYGEQADFTGIKTGEPEKILNVVTKSNVNGGQFGGASISGNTNEQFGGSFTGNFWRADKQISGSGNASTNGQGNGLSTNNSMSVNYRDTWNKKVTISANVRYEYTHNNFSANSYTQTNNESGEIVNESITKTDNIDKSYSINSEINYHIDPTSYLIITPNFSGNNQNGRFSQKSSETGVVNQIFSNKNITSQTNPVWGIAVFFGHRFKKPGRIMSLNLNFSHRINPNNQLITDTLRYTAVNGTTSKDSLLDRAVFIGNNSIAKSATFTYSEPIKLNTSIDIIYNYNQNIQNNNIITYNIDEFNSYYRIDSLSNVYGVHSTSQKIDLNYRYYDEKLRAQLGFALQANELQVSYEELYDPINKNSTTLSPVANIDYVFSESDNAAFNYSGNSVFPTLGQLQPVEDTRNLQNIIVGNPYLKPSFTHNISFDYFNISSQNNRTFSVKLNGSVTTNQVAVNTILVKDTLNNFKQETHYLNANGAYNFSAAYTYAIPLINKGLTQINLDFNGLVGLGNYISFSDFVKGTNKSYNLSQSVKIVYNTEKIMLNSQANYSNSTNRSTIGINTPLNIQSLILKTSGIWVLSKTIKINTEVVKNINSGYPAELNANPLTINAGFETKLFKNNRASLRVQTNDLLNQGKVLQHSFSGNALSASETNYVTRFTAITFNMRLESFRKTR